MSLLVWLAESDTFVMAEWLIRVADSAAKHTPRDSS